MYSIIEVGGKQYKVSEGSTFCIEKINSEINSFLDLDNIKVLLLNDGNTIKIGKPILTNVKVFLKVINHGKMKKIIVYKFKPKKNYRKKQGHRQQYTEVLVDKIECKKINE